MAHRPVSSLATLARRARRDAQRPRAHAAHDALLAACHGLLDPDRRAALVTFCAANTTNIEQIDYALRLVADQTGMRHLLSY